MRCQSVVVRCSLRTHLDCSPSWLSRLLEQAVEAEDLPLAWANVGYQRTENPWSYMAFFFVTILPVSCLATWIFNRTRESVLLVSLFHIAINLADFVLVLPAKTGQAVLLVNFVVSAAVVSIIYRAGRGLVASGGRPAR